MLPAVVTTLSCRRAARVINPATGRADRRTLFQLSATRCRRGRVTSSLRGHAADRRRRSSVDRVSSSRRRRATNVSRWPRCERHAPTARRCSSSSSSSDAWWPVTSALSITLRQLPLSVGYYISSYRRADPFFENRSQQTYIIWCQTVWF